MHDERDWADIPSPSASPLSDAGFGALRITLLFGSLAVAVALFAAPLLDRGDQSQLASGMFYPGIDRTATAGVRQYRNQYTVRRSVLQSNRAATCIIHSNGRQTGDC